MRGRAIAELAAGAAVLVVAAAFLAYAVANTGRAGSDGGLALRAKFDRIDGLAPGADVRIAGVRVGSVVDQRVDPQTFLAVVSLQVDGALRLPTDTSAEITSEGLLGGRYIALVPGGSERILQDGGDLEITQSAVSLEALLGRFIFSVTELAGQQQQREQGATGAVPAPSAAPPTGAVR
jgi:phospholipid/cholesterol/gamma-HCH transport system substrate-binding protein